MALANSYIQEKIRHMQVTLKDIDFHLTNASERGDWYLEQRDGTYKICVEHVEYLDDKVKLLQRLLAGVK